MKKSVFLLSCLLLSSCATFEPEVFGVPESSWKKLSPQQQERAMQEYYAAERRKEQHDIINNVFTGFADLVVKANGVKE